MKKGDYHKFSLYLKMSDKTNYCRINRDIILKGANEF